MSKEELDQFFSEVEGRIRLAGRKHVLDSREMQIDAHRVMHFMRDVGTRVQQAESQRNRINRVQATNFNIFGLIEPDENGISDIIADVLNPTGTHGQGETFLRLLFRQLGIGKTSAAANATVQREAPTHGIQKYRRRIDILVDAGMLLAIENKVDALEQPEQVADYLNHLRVCRHEHALIYLTPNGRRPDSLTSKLCQDAMECGRLHCWSYQNELRSWLDACRRACRAPRFAMFLGDLIVYIENNLWRETTALEMEETDEG